jgi:hypothetical protein
MATAVKRGQLWSVILTTRERVGFRVVRVGPGDDGWRRAFGQTEPGGRELSFRTAALAQGQRGARLVEVAPGSPAPASATPVHGRRASRVSGQAIAAARRVAKGESYGAVAEDLGVTTETVRRWVREVGAQRAVA